MTIKQKDDVDIMPCIFHLLIIAFSFMYAIEIVAYSVYNDTLMKGINYMIIPLFAATISNALYHNSKTFYWLEKYKYFVVGILYAESFLCCDSRAFWVFAIVIICMEVYGLVYDFLYEIRVLIAFFIVCEAFAIVFLKFNISNMGRIVDFVTSYKLDIATMGAFALYYFSLRFQNRLQGFFSNFKIRLDDKQQKIIVLISLILIMVFIRVYASTFVYKQMTNNHLTYSISGEELLQCAVEIKDFQVEDDGSLLATSNDPWIIVNLDDMQGIDKSCIKNMMVDIGDIYSNGENIQIYYIEDIYDVDTYKEQTGTIYRGKNVLKIADSISSSEYIRLDLLNIKGRRILLSDVTFNYYELDYIWCDVIIGVGICLLIYNVWDAVDIRRIRDRLYVCKNH